jgi:hypothetical protein
VWNFLVGLLKLTAISLIAGAALSAFDLSAADILAKVGLTEAKALELLQKGAAWAIPNIMLGSIVILPIWIVVYLLRPPGNS